MNLSMSIIWLLIFAILMIVELVTMGLTTIWFAAGALLACIVAALRLPTFVQIAVFFITSGVLLYFTRPIAVKFFNKSRVKTNVESLVGKEAIVITDINNLQETGQVKIQGMEWSARSSSGEEIKAGAVVTVNAVEGVKLIVEE